MFVNYTLIDMEKLKILCHTFFKIEKKSNSNNLKEAWVGELTRTKNHTQLFIIRTKGENKDKEEIFWET